MDRKVKVILQPVTFRKKNKIAIICIHCSELDEIIRDIEGAEWSSGYRFWHIPYRKDILKEIINTLKKIAIVDHSAFTHFHPKDLIIKPKTNNAKSKINKANYYKFNTLIETRHNFEKVGYRESTIRIYIGLLKIFFGHFNNKNSNEINLNDVELFMNSYFKNNGFSRNYKLLMANAIRSYYKLNGNNLIASYKCHAEN